MCQIYSFRYSLRIYLRRGRQKSKDIPDMPCFWEAYHKRRLYVWMERMILIFASSMLFIELFCLKSCWIEKRSSNMRFQTSLTTLILWRKCLYTFWRRMCPFSNVIVNGFCSLSDWINLIWLLYESDQKKIGFFGKNTKKRDIGVIGQAWGEDGRI